VYKGKAYILGRGALNDKPPNLFSLNGNLDLAEFLGLDFQRDKLGMVKEDAITSVCEVERNVLVSYANLLVSSPCVVQCKEQTLTIRTTRSAVFVPHIHRSSIPQELSKLLTKTVNLLTYVETEVQRHVRQLSSAS